MAPSELFFVIQIKIKTLSNFEELGNMYDIEKIHLELSEFVFDDPDMEKVEIDGVLRPVEHKRDIPVELNLATKESQQKNYFGTFSKSGDTFEQITLVYTVNLGAKIQGHILLKHKGFVKGNSIEVKSKKEPPLENLDLGSDSDCNVDDVADEKPISQIPKSVTKKGEDLKIHINEFYLDLP